MFTIENPETKGTLDCRVTMIGENYAVFRHERLWTNRPWGYGMVMLPYDECDVYACKDLTTFVNFFELMASFSIG
jgi:hypothetical protein